MDTSKQLLFLTRTDKSDSIESFIFTGSKCNIVYKNSPIIYRCSSYNIWLYSLQKTIDLSSVIVTINGEADSQIDYLLEFGEYYKIIYRQYNRVYPRKAISCRKTIDFNDVYKSNLK